MPFGTNAYFIDGFFIRWSGSILYQSIYLSRSLEFRKRGSLPKGTSFMCSLKAFLNTNVVSFLGKKNTRNKISITL